jgi:DNA-binding SARP family transcriptional activator
MRTKAGMYFKVLGPVEVVSGEALVTPKGDVQLRALALLLLHAGETVPLSRLLDGVWGEDPPRTAKESLRNVVRALREQTGTAGGVEFTSERAGYRVRLSPRSLDLDTYYQLSTAGRSAQAAGEPERAAVLLRQALRLWRGDPLANLDGTARDWPEVRVLNEHRLTTLEDRIDADLCLSPSQTLIDELETLVLAEPLRERLHGQLMEALYRTGRTGEALYAYRRARQSLIEAWGIEPGPVLRHLREAIAGKADAAIAGRRRRAAIRAAGTALAVRVEPARASRSEQGVQDDPGRIREQVAAAVRPFGGTIAAEIGTLLLVLFRSAHSGDGHAESAVRAALAIRDAVAAWRFGGSPGGDGDYVMRAAIASGEILVKTVDWCARPLIAGPDVDAALSLVAAPPAWRILVSDRTRTLSRDGVRYRRWTSGPADVWEAVAVASHPRALLALPATDAARKAS